MEQLKEIISVKSGITNEQAEIAIKEIADELKRKFPSILHGEIDNVLNGKNFGDHYKARLEDVKGKVEEAAKNVGERAEGILNELKDKLNEMFSTKKNPPSA